MSPRIHSLSNGVRVVCDPLPGFETLALSVVCGRGSRIETPAQSGWAHLLEHMVFKGAAGRSARQIVEAVEASGGQINAATGHERTSFQTRALKGGLELMMRITADLVLRPDLDPKELKREKGVVGQEIAEARDTPDDQVFELAQGAAFPDQPLGRPILGEVKTVRGADCQALAGFRAEVYAPDRLVISAAGAVDEVLYGNVFEGLVRIGPRGDIQPALAESWEITPDGLTYVFHLRPGVRFHNGAPFDASVVKFTLDRARAPASTNAQKTALSVIAKVDVVDPQTVRLTLSRPSSRLLSVLAWGDSVMVEPRSVGDIASHPVGTGPYQFQSWRRGNAIDLARNPHYWGKPAHIERVEFRFIADPTAAFAAMKAGDLDVFPDYPAPENLAQFKADPLPFAVDPAFIRPWLESGSKVDAISGDRDVFGDGTVTILSTPGHTPGETSLLVRLAQTGPVLLSGDVAHFEEQFASRGVPGFNFDRAQTLASMERLTGIAKVLKATLVVQHDANDIGKLPTFPKSAR